MALAEAPVPCCRRRYCRPSRPARWIPAISRLVRRRPLGYVAAGGDLSPGVLDNGALVVGNPLENGAVLLGPAGCPLAVGTSGASITAAMALPWSMPAPPRWAAIPSTGGIYAEGRSATTPGCAIPSISSSWGRHCQHAGHPRRNLARGRGRRCPSVPWGPPSPSPRAVPLAAAVGSILVELQERGGKHHGPGTTSA